MRLDDLPSGERAEIEEILAEARRVNARFGTERFVSDEGDSMAFPLLFWIAAILGIGAVFVNWSPAALLEESGWFLRGLPRSILSLPHIPGFALALVVLVWAPLHFLRVHGRHGWMVTSFAFVRIRGSKLLVARHADVKRASKRVIRSPRNSFSVVELEMSDGRRVTSYAGKLYDALCAKLPPGAAT